MLVLRRVTACAALGLGVFTTGCGGDDPEPVACVPVSDAVADRFGDDPFGATVADPEPESGRARWFYGRPNDVLFISDIDPEGDGSGEIRSLTANASTYATEQRDPGGEPRPDGSTFPDDGPASLSFASNESAAAGGRAIQCADGTS